MTAPRQSGDSNPALTRRDFLSASVVAAGGGLLPSLGRAADRAQSGELAIKNVEPWAPHPKAAPKTSRRAHAFAIDANGTRTCTGGWQWLYEGVTPGATYEVSMETTHHGVAVPRDALNCTAVWRSLKPGQSGTGVVWEYLLPANLAPDRVRFSRRIVAPAGASQLTLRATLRWISTGNTVWQAPRVVAVEPEPKPPPVRVSVVTGTFEDRRGRQFKSAQENTQFYGDLCEAACRRDRPELIVLPEVALHWGVRGHPLDLASPAPGPETDAFAAIARRHRVRIGVGMYERDGDAVFNSLVLLNPAGDVEGRYRKVHLAQSEDLSGILPGENFPVFPTELGRIGCNICMDSMVPESARMVGLNGADILLLPIMGDFRADRWDVGPPTFHEDRWRTIMRAQALDNQFCLAVARNRAAGSCVVSRQGEFLAWNDGSQPFVTADVPREDGFRSWNGSCFRDSAWMIRRPHLYGAFTDAANPGGVI